MKKPSSNYNYHLSNLLEQITRSGHLPIDEEEQDNDKEQHAVQQMDN